MLKIPLLSRFVCLQGQRRVVNFSPRLISSLNIQPRRSFCQFVAEKEEDEIESKNYKFPVPKYQKIQAWDKDSKDLKILGRILSSKRDRTESDSVVLEGVTIIKEALSHGHVPSVIVFSREKLLWRLGLEGDGKKKLKSKLYHIPFSNIKMWTDLTTSPGIMAAFSKQDIQAGAVASSPVSLSLICDNVRNPDNLGAVIRVAAAAGARQILLTKGCVNAWSPKVVRSAAGSHFLIKIVENVSWQSLEAGDLIDQYPKVLLADLVHDLPPSDEIQERENQRALEELEQQCQEEGETNCYNNPELCEKYQGLPLETLNHRDLASLPGYKEAVVVIGGETEGVSGAAHMFCHKHQGAKLHVPLRNNVNSLNVISAASLVLFSVRDALLNTKQHKD